MLTENGPRPWIHLVDGTGVTPDRPVTVDFIEVSFQAAQDDEKRRYLNNIGTNLDLDDEQVDHLISAAREVLRASPELKNYLDFSRGSKEQPK